MRTRTKIKTLSGLVILSLAATSVSQAGVKEFFGRVSGALIGGALCNELGIGGGNGRTAAIALCAIGGSMIGGEIGRDMDEADARAFEDSQRRSFDGDLNRDYDWDGSRYGSRTGVRGRLRPVRHGYHRQTREVCREYQTVTHRGNRTSKKQSIVCRRSDGSFYSLEEKTLFINGRVVERERNEREGNGNNPPYITPDRRTPPPPPRPVPYPDYGREYDRDNRYCSGWDIRLIRKGDQVFTRSGQVGAFQGFSRSRTEASVKIYNYIQIFRSQDLGLTGCHFGLTSGQRVATRYGQQGIVGGIFSNGDVAVQMPHYIQILRRDDLFY